MKPLLVHELRPVPEPSDVCAALEGLEYRIFFDSAGLKGKYARYSFVAADPVAVIRAKDGDCKIIPRHGSPPETTRTFGNALIQLRRLLSGFAFNAIDGLPPFQGGAAGFIGYEFGSQLEHVSHPSGDLELPDLCMGLYDSVFAWDHEMNKAWLISRSESREKWFLDSWQRGTKPKAASTATRMSGTYPEPQSSLSRTQFEDVIVRIREYIAAGDIFQANFSQRFHAPLSAHPWDLFLTLRETNPAPFSCFFESGDVTVISASPERFIKIAARRAETRPIKGTAARRADLAADKCAQADLLASAKDNAEHVMIVDVLRNDLSRVCKVGTVNVEELATLESHPTVHHLVSTITGELRDECDPVDVLLASLPGGSITGAPKIRAMEIIAELEPVRRNVYCGCMLYITPEGVMDSSIVIRTFLATKDTVFFSAGGGIVADSDPGQEYVETLHKAAALFAALRAVS